MSQMQRPRNMTASKRLRGAHHMQQYKIDITLFERGMDIIAIRFHTQSL